MYMTLGFIQEKSDTRNDTTLPRIQNHNDTVSRKQHCIHCFTLSLNILSLVLVIVQFALNFTEFGGIIWGVPFLISLTNLFLVLPVLPTWHCTKYDVPYFVLYNPLALALAMYLRVALELFVAFWFSMWLLVCLIPLLRNDMVNYGLDTLRHTISSMSLYSIIRSLSAYFVTLGLPLSVSNVIPFVIASLESFGMFLMKNESYTFSTRSKLFLHYVVLKAAVFLALPHLENYVLMEVQEMEVQYDTGS